MKNIKYIHDCGVSYIKWTSLFPTVVCNVTVKTNFSIEDVEFACKSNLPILYFVFL